jgi:hypothetical protein
MDSVSVAEKVAQLVWAVWLEDRISSTYLNQRLVFKAAVSSTPASKLSIKKLATAGGRCDPMANSYFCKLVR